MSSATFNMFQSIYRATRLPLQPKCRHLCHPTEKPQPLAITPTPHPPSTCRQLSTYSLWMCLLWGVCKWDPVSVICSLVYLAWFFFLRFICVTHWLLFYCEHGSHFIAYLFLGCWILSWYKQCLCVHWCLSFCVKYAFTYSVCIPRRFYGAHNSTCVTSNSCPILFHGSCIIPTLTLTGIVSKFFTHASAIVSPFNFIETWFKHDIALSWKHTPSGL